ncbi:hypothetical protein SEA_VASANTI_25 [Gordonia phage Vasanti]|uniref:Uncharacterized protein n=1 Tax=Gordonia phage Vasanti TaxID=2502431 RepID=A0A411BVX3_9CAUD|nr:hypothetical protein PP493_gp25 [Gordonia phage Vasanti]QAY05763.1 hypothetical protein SEA_VASANTI_25 [Gordonia phage Vasanti]
MIVNVDGVQLDLRVREGVLEVGRADKTWIGSMFVGHDPEPEPAQPAVDQTPSAPILPENWTRDDDGTIRDASGRSIYGVSPTEPQQHQGE